MVSIVDLQYNTYLIIVEITNDMVNYIHVLTRREKQFFSFFIASFLECLKNNKLGGVVIA